jgi:hypothetical protein
MHVSLSLGLSRSTPINMYQGYAIQSFNIRRHTFLQHDNQSLGSFFILPPPTHPSSAVPPPWRAAPPLGVLHHHFQWPTTTSCDNRGADNGSTTIAEPAAAATVAAPAATLPPPPFTTTTATPRGPSTSTPGPAPFRCGLVPGGSTSSSLSHRPCWPALFPTVFLRN